MRKIILALIVAGFALTVFFSLKPQAMSLVVAPDEPATSPIDEPITLNPVSNLVVVQGGDSVALMVKNNTSDHYSFSLGHEHSHVTLQPQGGRLTPWMTSEITLQVDPKCPPGEIVLPVYLRADINGVRTGFETTVSVNVLAGELSLEQQAGEIMVIWSGEPAPRGTAVYYRVPGTVDWKLWGEAPRLDPPADLSPGDYLFEFKAILGDVESAIESFEVTVEEPVVKAEPEPERAPSSSGGGSSAPAAEPEPEPEYADQDSREGQREIRQAYNGLKEIETKYNMLYKPFGNTDSEKKDLISWKNSYLQIIKALKTKYGINYEYKLAGGAPFFPDGGNLDWMPFD